MSWLSVFARFHLGWPAVGLLVLVACYLSVWWLACWSLRRRDRAGAIVYPARDAALASTRRLVLVRFAPREAANPVDVASLEPGVDGIDRASRFTAVPNKPLTVSRYRAATWRRGAGAGA